MNARTEEPIVLFTPYFAAPTPERQHELDTCLRRNVACRDISKIYLLSDDGHLPPVRNQKIEVIRTQSRPTYRQWIELSRTKCGSAVSILANSDIHFDETLEKVRKILCLPEAFIALSRHERLGDKAEPHPNPHWSQDVWGFNAASSIPNSLLKYIDIPLGVPRCDNKVAYSFAVHGWRIYNPVHFVRSIHLHETQQRSYDKKGDLTVIGGVAYVHPSGALEKPSHVEIDIWARNSDAIRSVKLNKSLDKWAAERIEQPHAVGPDSRTRSERKIADPSQAGQRHTVELTDKPVPAVEQHHFVTRGKVVFDHLQRFKAYQYQNEILCLDWLQIGSARKAPAGTLLSPKTGSIATDRLLEIFIPPVLSTSPIDIGSRPAHKSDCHFWQYPCATEKQAYENHLSLRLGQHIDPERRIIHTYLGLPWATYIDKKVFPEDVPAFLRPRLAGYKKLARAHGYELAIHTVCQQIHWRRLVEQFHEVGITDLHLSHCEKNIDPQHDGYRFRVHSWPLIAVNFEDPARAAGLQPDKPISEKRYLASFIGAHMPHYRSDVRPRLLDAAKADGGNDIFFELNGEWHFNRIVYQEQVQNKPLPQEELQKNQAAALRYNQILSDSIFSICPEGSGPNTLRVWESLAVGAIPVVIADEWIAPKIEVDGQSLDEFCIFVKKQEIDGLFAKLRTINQTTLVAKRAACLQAYRQARALRTYHVSTSNTATTPLLMQS